MGLESRLTIARRRMVETDLKGRGITSPRVLDAMGRVPREQFVVADFQSSAYGDRALPIDCKQTISQPYMVALMTEVLEIQGSERVLEVGTGSGYQTAVLAELAAEVVTIERHPKLSLAAQQILGKLSYKNIEFITGDGSLGHEPGAPYDRIMITAAASECPPALLEQLHEQGILVGPFGGRQSQMLQRVEKRIGVADHWNDVCACRFVPLVNQPG